MSTSNKGKGKEVVDVTATEQKGDEEEEWNEYDDNDDDEDGGIGGANGDGEGGSGKKRKMDAELLRKNRSLAELLLLMDDYAPVIPDAVTDYYLARSGFECDDIRIKRVLGLAAQKFISDLATDAFQYCKIRAQNSTTKDRKGQMKDKRAVLTMDDLAAALGDHGVNIKRPEYFL
ncbi:Transcription initiation factor TFIID subunit 10 [Quaeritorhiza haematococci]|nr:Transcription initiation factor TFIID subunit 10 [Quaeritorhiza haematococci]